MSEESNDWGKWRVGVECTDDGVELEIAKFDECQTVRVDDIETLKSIYESLGEALAEHALRTVKRLDTDAQWLHGQFVECIGELTKHLDSGRLRGLLIIGVIEQLDDWPPMGWKRWATGYIGDVRDLSFYAGLASRDLADRLAECVEVSHLPEDNKP